MSTDQGGQPARNGWNLDSRWQASIDGTACEFCRRDEPTRATYPTEVARLRVSRWFLGANQYVRGYSVLILDRHAIELHDLDRTERRSFVEDIADAGCALERALHPIKMNIELLGNVVPHLHCHLKPRYPDDQPGHARIFQDAQVKIMSPAELEQLATMLRSRIRDNSE